jgi:hypothetical protein
MPLYCPVNFSVSGGVCYYQLFLKRSLWRYILIGANFFNLTTVGYRNYKDG